MLLICTFGHTCRSTLFAYTGNVECGFILAMCKFFPLIGHQLTTFFLVELKFHRIPAVSLALPTPYHKLPEAKIC